MSFLISHLVFDTVSMFFFTFFDRFTAWYSLHLDSLVLNKIIQGALPGRRTLSLIQGSKIQARRNTPIDFCHGFRDPIPGTFSIIRRNGYAHWLLSWFQKSNPRYFLNHTKEWIRPLTFVMVSEIQSPVLSRSYDGMVTAHWLSSWFRRSNPRYFLDHMKRCKDLSYTRCGHLSVFLGVIRGLGFHHGFQKS